MTPHGQTICLNMIVRNEAPVIARCLTSLKHLIDYWVIVDTGSNDGTQAIIREALSDVPGELHESVWVNFAVNRSEALCLARGKGDYVLTIDADEVLVFDQDFAMPRLVADSYVIAVQFSGYNYVRKQLVSNRLDWRYEGVVHEYAVADDERSEQLLEGVVIVPRHDGARARDPNTYRRDALILEHALIDDPGNARYVFYLAQSYRDAGELGLAIRSYRKRAAMGGWPEEVWCALWQTAALREQRGDPWPEVQQDLLTAFEKMPDRAEPIFRIGLHYQRRREFHLAYLFLGRAATIPMPATKRLFVQASIYEYEAALELAVAAYYVGDDATSIRLNNALLRNPGLPPHVRLQIIQNRRYSLDRMVDARPSAGPARTLHVLIEACVSIEETLESLQTQSVQATKVTIIGAIEAADPLYSLVKDIPNIRVWSRSVEAYIRETVASDDVVLRVAAGDRLANTTVLENVLGAFSDPGCYFAFGRRRTPTGALEPTEPWISPEDFETRGAEAIGGSTFALRGDLARSLKSDLSAPRALSYAGLKGARYLDQVWSVAQPEPSPMPKPARPRAGLPLISALMVTHDRLALAKRAVRSFAAQTYPNRELVIVSDGPGWCRRNLREYAAEVAPEVRFIEPEEAGQTLGRLRNLALESATGEIVCQWDDDDLSHPERLAQQYDHMAAEAANASFLTDHLHLLSDQNLLCWVDWSGGGTIIGPSQLAPGTLMMRAQGSFRYPETGPLARQGEDSVMLELLFRAGKIAALRDAAPLFLYTFHGRNTFSRDHHYNVGSYRASVERVSRAAPSIREAARHFELPLPCYVVGREGLAFVL